MSDLPAGFVELPADAQLDAAAPTDPAPAQQPMAAPAVATHDTPQGYVELPHDVPLDHENPSAPPPLVKQQPKMVDAYHLDHQFGDTTGPAKATFRLDPEVEHGLLKMLVPGVTEAKILDYARTHGNFAVPDAAAVAQAANDPNKRINSNVNYVLPAPTPVVQDGTLAQTDTGQALSRGVADMASLGTANKLFAGLDAGNDWLAGKDAGASYHAHLDQNNANTQSDEANHPGARLAGMLIGGLAINPELAPVALEAGRAALRGGATMPMARAAAAKAAVMQQAKIGAVQGGAYGVGSADNIRDAATGGVTGAVTGGIGGYALAKAATPAFLDPITRKLQQWIPGTDYAAMASKMGFDATPASTGTIGRALQYGFHQMPGAAEATVSGNQAEQRGLGEFTQKVANSLGTPSSASETGEDIASGAHQWVKGEEDSADTLYKNRNALMGGDSSPVPLPLTQKALADLETRYPNSPALNDLMTDPSLRKLKGVVPDAPTTQQVPTGLLDAQGKPITKTVTNAPNDLNLDEATTALSYARRAVRRQEMNPDIDPDLAAASKGVKNAINADLRNAATKSDAAAGRVSDPENPNATALDSHNAADAKWANMMGAIKKGGSLNRALATNEDPIKASAEGLYRQMSNDMSAQNGNVARLRDTFFKLSPEAQGSFAATKISQLGGGTGDDWQFGTFLKNWKAMNPQSRNAVFGTSADSDLRDVATYAERLRSTRNLKSFSNTPHGIFSTFFTVAMMAAFKEGNFAEAGAEAAAPALLHGVGELFMRAPKFRVWTVNTMKTLANTSMPQTIKEGKLAADTNRLSRIAAQDPTIASQVLGLRDQILSAVNDNIGPHSVAAQSGGISPTVSMTSPNAANNQGN